MAKFIQVSTSIVGIPMPALNPLTRQQEIRLQLASTIVGVKDDGTVWEYDSAMKKWKPFPMDEFIPETPEAPDGDRFKL